MALAFMLNPSTKRKRRRGKKRCLTAKQMAALRKGWKRARCGKRSAWGRSRKPRKRKATAKEKAIAGTIIIPESPKAGPIFLNNPRKKKRRGKKGGRRMARRKKARAGRRRKAARRGWTRAKRIRAGRKAWRKRLRRYPKKRSSVGRRGYKNNPRKRRRNPLAVRGMYSNPRKRRKNPRRASWKSKLRRKNPRRSPGRRRNPLNLGGTLNSIKGALMNPNALMQFAAGAAAGSVAGLGGAWIANKIASFAPETFVLDTMPRRILDAASTIAAAVLIAGFAPQRFRTAIMLGGGVAAVKPLVDQALKDPLAQLSKAMGFAGVRGMNGISGWISVNQVPRIGMAGARGGVGAWISAQQMGRLGMSGLGDAYSFSYGQPVGSLEDYSRQPYAGSGVGPDSAFSM